MIGTLINSAAVVVGSLLGMKLKVGLSERQLESVRFIVGLISVLIGVSMFSGNTSILTVLVSLIVGTLVGEAVDVDGRLNALGSKIKSVAQGGSRMAESFYTSTLLFVVGPMAILGPIYEAIHGDMSILLTKSLIDGITSAALAASIGPGVLFSSVSVFIYQGLFYLVGVILGGVMPNVVISAITSTGGVLIMAIGLNLLGVTKLRVGNMLPSLLAAAAIALLISI
ncbi:MAG TPA: DUF554 domain-containing protein [Thermoproteota archaeon]|nr:DUF554 domain-containing protein [Thermoproteota archaeon]